MWRTQNFSIGGGRWAEKTKSEFDIRYIILGHYYYSPQPRGVYMIFVWKGDQRNLNLGT